MRTNAKALFNKAAAMAERDIFRRCGGSTYRLENYFTGWILKADGVAISGPFQTLESAMAALDSVAPTH